MGNLVKETPYSEVTATLEGLDCRGVVREDLSRLRTDSGRLNAVALLMRGESAITGAQPASACPFFANEEVASNYGYPAGYGVKPVADQLVILAKHFPALNAEYVLGMAKELLPLPTGAEGYFVYPKWQKAGKTYNDGVEAILDKLGTTRSFTNWRKGELGPKRLQQCDRTLYAEQYLGNQQKGDYLVVPSQFGLLHRGRSVRRARALYLPNEFGHCVFAGGCMTLTHPERFICWEQLQADLPGDEYDDSGADRRFADAPILDWSVGALQFSAYWSDDAGAHFGSVSGFLTL